MTETTIQEVGKPMIERDMTYNGWAQAFLIFAKYEPKGIAVSVGYDVIYAGPAPANVSDEDKKELERYGWHGEDIYGCFRRFT